MLQQPDEHHRNILKLADHIEQSEKFDMGNWRHCIYGHAIECANIHLAVSKLRCLAITGYTSEEDARSTIAEVMDWLGLPVENWHRLMSNADQSKAQAVSMLRHLAVTDEFPEDWNPAASLKFRMPIGDYERRIRIFHDESNALEPV